MRNAKWSAKTFLSLMLVLVVLSGCRLFYDDVILHDELFTYEAPLDKTYFTILQAIGNCESWVLQGTDKIKGEIYVARAAHGSRDVATVLVSRVSREKTAVELAPGSQSLRGVDELLKAIDRACMSK